MLYYWCKVCILPWLCKTGENLSNQWRDCHDIIADIDGSQIIKLINSDSSCCVRSSELSNAQLSHMYTNCTEKLLKLLKLLSSLNFFFVALGTIPIHIEKCTWTEPQTLMGGLHWDDFDAFWTLLELPAPVMPYSISVPPYVTPLYCQSAASLPHVLNTFC